MTKEWPIINSRILLYIDIMGFKDMVLSTNPAELHKTLTSVMQLTSQMKHIGYADLDRVGETNFPEIKSQTFSDSIVFVSEGISLNDIYVMTKGAKWVSTLLFQYGIPFRGAIASGIMTYDQENSIFFGEPLINAYLLEQELDLFGIMAHHSFEHILRASFKDKFTKDSLQDFVPFPIKTKHGKAKHLILDWIKFAQDIHKDENFHHKLHNILSCQMSGAPRHYLDNTMTFIQECLDRPIIDRHKPQTAHNSK